MRNIRFYGCFLCAHSFIENREEKESDGEELNEENSIFSLFAANGVFTC